MNESFHAVVICILVSKLKLESFQRFAEKKGKQDMKNHKTPVSELQKIIDISLRDILLRYVSGLLRSVNFRY
jgi:hypothetical protein